MKILLADADIDLLDLTAFTLRRAGFEVITAGDGEQALKRWQEDQPDVVVLEINLPRRNGFEVCRQIRESGSTPVIMLSTLDTDPPIVRAFRLGADDYLTKPFRPRELALRIRAVWRRTTEGRAGVTELTERTGELRIGEVVLDLETHEVRQGRNSVRFTPLEFRLLYLLARNAGRVVRRTQLVDYAWSYDEGDITRLKSHISHVRKKLQRVCGGDIELRAVSGIGYQLHLGRGT